MSNVEKIKSPCRSICILQEDEMSGVEYCIGCFRTVNEIQDWYGLKDRIRADIWNSLDYREKNI